MNRTLLLCTLLTLGTSCADSPPRSGEAPQKDWSKGCDATDVEHSMVDVGEVTLHVACQGQGPTIILLHGFPEFWYGWNPVLEELAQHFRVIMPDQRGYNLSSKPQDVDAYRVSRLAADIEALINVVSPEGVAAVVGHDWGGAIAWTLAHKASHLVERLVVLNGPHPNVFARELQTNPAQRAASAYITFLLGERAGDFLQANHYQNLARSFEDFLSPQELALYREAWSQPGALTAMLNWYRANVEEDLNIINDDVITVDIPTRVLWGQQDSALLEGNLVGLEDYASDVTIERLPDAGHWVVHDAPNEITSAIINFVLRGQ
jgi:pimeloyl-ACP methyl ester carboxylesterase